MSNAYRSSSESHLPVDEYMSFMTSPAQGYQMDETYTHYVNEEPRRPDHRLPSSTPLQHLVQAQQQAQQSLQQAQLQLNQRTHSSSFTSPLQTPYSGNNHNNNNDNNNNNNYVIQQVSQLQQAQQTLNELQQTHGSILTHDKKQRHTRHSSVNSNHSSPSHHSPNIAASHQSALTQQLAQFASSTLQSSPHLSSMPRSTSGTALLNMVKQQPSSPSGFTLSSPPITPHLTPTIGIPGVHLNTPPRHNSTATAPATATATATGTIPTSTSLHSYSHRNSAPNLAAMDGTTPPMSQPTFTHSTSQPSSLPAPLAAPPARPVKSSSRAPSTHQPVSPSLPDSVSLRRIKSSPVSLNSLDAKFGPPAIGGMTPPTPTLSKSRSGSSRDLKTTQQKAQRRLARKAEAARASRRRKKHYVQSLEEKVAKLTLKLNELEHANRTPQQTLEQAYRADMQAHIDSQNEIKQRLVTLVHELKTKSKQSGVPIPQSHSITSLSTSPIVVNSASSQPMSTASTPRSMKSHSSSPSSSSSSSFSPSPPSSLVPNLTSSSPSNLSSSPSSTFSDEHDELKQLSDRFVSNSRKRQNQVDYYLQQLNECMVPGVAVKFAIWGLSQRDDFYTEQGLWYNVMGKEVGLSDIQMDQLMSFRHPVQQCMQSLHQTTQQLKNLNDMIRAHLDRSHQQLDELRSLLTPFQFAAFSVWVEHNPLCSQMLDTIWKKGMASAS